MWDVVEKKLDDGSTTIGLYWKGITMAIFTLPKSMDLPMSILYKDATKNGKLNMVECRVHKTFTERIPPWASRITYPVEKDYIIYRIYNEIAIKFTVILYNNGTLRVKCPTKMTRVPLDDKGHPIRKDIRIIALSEQGEEEFQPLQKSIESADIKVRRKSA